MGRSRKVRSKVRTFFLGYFHARGDVGDDCAFEIHSLVDVWMFPRFSSDNNLSAIFLGILDNSFQVAEPAEEGVSDGVPRDNTSLLTGFGKSLRHSRLGGHNHPLMRLQQVRDQTEAFWSSQQRF